MRHMAGKQALSPNQHSLCEMRQIGIAAFAGTFVGVLQVPAGYCTQGPCLEVAVKLRSRVYLLVQSSFYLDHGINQRKKNQ